MLKYLLPLVAAVRPSVVQGMIRSRMGESIPFNTLLGLEITTVGAGVAEARLAYRAALANHIGSVHATAIFGLAEAASGAAMMGAFAPVALSIRPVAAGAKIDFLKIAKGDLLAVAQTGQPAKTLLASLKRDGKVVFDVNVSVRDQAGDEVATLTVAWHVSKK